VKSESAAQELLNELAVSWAYLEAEGADSFFPSGRLGLLKELAQAAQAELAREREFTVDEVFTSDHMSKALGLAPHTRYAIRPITEPKPEPADLAAMLAGGGAP